MLDGDLGARMDFDRIGAEHVDHDLEVARVADFENRRARLHDGFALLRHLEHQTRHRRGNRPAIGRRVAAGSILRQQGFRLIDLVRGGVILEFRSAQVALGDAHGGFGAFERLRRRHAAFGQGAGAVEIVLGLHGLRLCALDHGLAAFAAGFGGAQPFLGLAAAARIEKRRRRRQDRGDHVVGLHLNRRP